MDYRKASKEIASKGRFGDSALLHVHPDELSGLASLAPGGKLPTNPDTGLPEAFFFLPLLAGLGSLLGLGGAAAGTAGLGAAAAAGGAGALGAGLMTGLTAGTAALPTLAGGAAAAGELAAGLAPVATAATAAPELAAGLGTLATTAAPVTEAATGLGGLASAVPAVDPIVTGATAAAPSVTGSTLFPASQIVPAGVADATYATGPLASQLTPGLQSTAGVSSLAGPTAPIPPMSYAPAVSPLNPTVATTIPQAGDLAAGIGPQPISMSGIGSDAVAAPVTAPVAAPSPLTPGAVDVPSAGAFPSAPSASGAVGPTDYFPLAPEAPNQGIGGLLQKGKGLLGGIDPTQMLLMSSMLGRGGGGGGGDDDDEAPDISDVHYEGGDPDFPGDDYEPGIDPEWRYFQSGGLVKKYADGGVAALSHPANFFDGVTSPTGKNLANFYDGVTSPTGKNLANFYDGVDSPTGKHLANFYDGVDSPTGKPMPVAGSPGGIPGPGQPPIGAYNSTYNSSPYKMVNPYLDNTYGASGQKVRGFAQGGLATMAQQPISPIAGTPPQGNPMAGQMAGMGAGTGLASLMEDTGPESIPTSPMPKKQIGSKTEGDQQLIEATVQAIKGQTPNAPIIIKKFVDTFGEAALDDLVERVRSTLMAQQPAQTSQMGGDGMSDSVPASIAGQEPARLSEGEFVVPSDVVSGLGNGSTDAGAQQLQGMMGRVRQMRTGGMVQPPAINARSAMPI